jgi:3D (Asp-Asp-Asp) domain-containing protein
MQAREKIEELENQIATQTAEAEAQIKELENVNEFLSLKNIDLMNAAEAFAEKDAEQTQYFVEVGGYVITFYTISEAEGTADGITATGTTCTENRTIAAPFDVLKPGTRVKIPVLGDYTYIVEDTGNFSGKHLDVYVPDIETAKKLGGKLTNQTILIEKEK